MVSYTKKLGKKAVVHLHDYIPISCMATALTPYGEHKHDITLDDAKLKCVKGFKHCVGISLLVITETGKEMGFTSRYSSRLN
jgi:hypothetical protein